MDEMEQIAEIAVRRFFDVYLTEVFPKQLAAAITGHNKDITAHKQQIRGAVRTESLRLKVWLMGLVFTGGLGGGFGIARFFLGN